MLDRILIQHSQLEMLQQKDLNPALTGTQTENKVFQFTIGSSETTATSRKIHLYIPPGVKRFAPDQAKTSKAGSATIDLIGPAAANTSRPMVVSIQRLRPASEAVVDAFQEAEVTGAFDVRIVFTEKPHDFKLAHISVDKGTASDLVVGVPFAKQGGNNANQTTKPHPVEGSYYFDNAYGSLTGLTRISTVISDTVPAPTGGDNMYHQYRVTITPHRRADMVKIHVKEFHDNAAPYPNVYKPFNVEHKPNGREQLRLKVNVPKFNREDGLRVSLPHSESAQITYANGKAGHYILTKDKDGSHIRHFHEKERGK